MSTGTDGIHTLSELSRLGGYFALPGRGDAPVTPLAQLADPATTGQFVDATRAAIATSMSVGAQDIAPRVAASSFQLGVAARLLSPMIGAALCHHVVPVLTPDTVFYLAAGHSPQLQTTARELRPAPDPGSAAAVISALLPDLFDPLHRSLRTVAGLSAQITLGNLASAANGAVTVLAMTRRDLERPGRALVADLTTRAPLRNTGHFRRGGFTRRSCCLFYQAPGGGLCGDCVLPESSTSHHGTQ